LNTNKFSVAKTRDRSFATEPVLSRELLENGAYHHLFASASSAVPFLTERERVASLQEMLLQRRAGPVWVFGYGSLIWNPALRYVERRSAIVQGWHRSFCLSMKAGRGSPDKPGLALGLESGGSCTGSAYRIDEHLVESELTLLWRREMFSTGYLPRWVDLLDQDGIIFGSAITFIINSASCQYAGQLSTEVVAERLATAFGRLGSAADYLFRTCAGLRNNGIPDSQLEALSYRVALLQRAGAIPNASV